jgi:hypothetical protein
MQEEMVMGISARASVRHAFLVWVLLALFLIAPAAHANVQVSVADTDPAADASLGRDEPFYVRIQFTADEPVSIWARPYFHGQRHPRAKSNASFAHSGTGYALGWFSLDDASEVDEVRIMLGGGKPYREWQAASLPVKLRGTAQLSEARTTPSWVDELREADKIAAREAREKSEHEPSSVGAMVFFPVFMLAMLAVLLGVFAAPAWAVWRWHGGWRLAAAIPAIVMAFVIGRIIVDTGRDPTSHNLWPFEVLIYGAPCLVALGVLALVRRFARKKE